MLLDALHAVLVVTLANDCPTKHVDAAMPANRKLGRMSKHQRAGIYWLVLVGWLLPSGGVGSHKREGTHFLCAVTGTTPSESNRYRSSSENTYFVRSPKPHALSLTSHFRMKLHVRCETIGTPIPVLLEPKRKRLSSAARTDRTKIVPTIPAACEPINDGLERPWRKPGATRRVACLPRRSI